MRCPKCKSDNPDESVFCAKCGTQIKETEEQSLPTKTIEAPREELTTGSTFARRYRIIEEIGKGGMGRVYKAQDTELKEKVALKLIKPEISADKKTVERFQNELKFARKIVHKNVGRMYDLGKEEGSYYITMEYVEGQDLKGMIRQSKQLTVGTAISIAKQVAEGLSEAHRLELIHRDLKPSNIMIDKDGSARIMDFGIARSVEGKGITGVGVMIGTPEYMPPEQAEAKGVDQRSDIYSLGVIMYEMLTGRVPFEGDTALSIAMKHKGEKPKDPREFNSQITEDLSRVILRCLEKDREKRYQSTGELRSALDNIEKGIPTTERIIPERKPLTSREITVQFSLKKLFLPALAIVVLAIITVILWRIIPQKEEVTVPEGKPSLAVMYFKNNTGDEGLDHWRTMLSNLLNTDLTQSKHIRVLSEDKLFNILNQLDQLDADTYSSEVLEQVAIQGRVNHILQGAYAKAGDEFRINVMLQDARTGELIGSESVAGKGEQGIFSMVDDLTKRIKSHFRLTQEQILSDLDREVGKITTSSPEALWYYTEGRKYHNLGEHRRSIQLMEKAVEIDPEFAMAYRAMATAYSNMGYGSEWTKYMQKAFELADRLSDRERYLIKGSYYAGSYKTLDQAIDNFNMLLELYPDDEIGNIQLGLIYASLEDWDKSIERYQVIIQNKVERYYPYLNIAGPYMAKGMYDEAQRVLESYLDNFPDHSTIHWGLAYVHLCRAEYEQALIEAEKAFSLNPLDHENLWLQGIIQLCKGDLTDAAKAIDKLLRMEERSAHLYARMNSVFLLMLQGKFRDSIDQFRTGIELAEKLSEKGWEANNRIYLSYVYIRLKKFDEALEECDKALQRAAEWGMLYQAIFAFYIKGLAYLEMGAMEEAQKTAMDMKKQIEEGKNRKMVRFYDNLIGMIALKRADCSEAIENFDKALSLLSSQTYDVFDITLFLGPLALAYYNAGDLEKAEAEYEAIMSLTVGRVGFADIYVKAFYMLGKIYEQQENTAKAIAHYEKFLDLWKDADPGIAEVDDAREQVAELKN